MFLTKVLLVCNDNPLYYQFINDVYDIWEKYINIDPYLFIITDDKSKIHLDLGNRRVKYIKPVENIPTAFQSQVIRLLLPCLFPNDYVIITDIDMIPLKKSFFKKYIKYIKDDFFIRYFQNYQMCYNCAKGEIWRNIFNIKSTKEMKECILKWFQKYNGVHITDQLVLREYLENYKGSQIILTSYLPSQTSIQRLSTYSSQNIFFEVEYKNLKNYVDFHMHNIFGYEKSITEYKKIVNYLLST